MPRALGALALRRVDLRVPDLAARRRARTGAAARSGAGGPAALPELPCEAAADQRAGEPTARARRCPGGAVRGSRCGADECAADHAGLAGAGGFGSTTLRRGEPALHTQAPVHGLLPGHQFRAFERPLRLLHRIRRSLKQGPF